MTVETTNLRQSKKVKEAAQKPTMAVRLPLNSRLEALIDDTNVDDCLYARVLKANGIFGKYDMVRLALLFWRLTGLRACSRFSIAL